MGDATTEISTGCLKPLFLDHVKDIEHSEPITIQIICSGYDIVTGGWGDNMISRVSDGVHWALAALDAKKFSATELHNQYKLMTQGTLLKVKSYEIRHYKHGKLCLLMRDFAFLEGNTGFEKAIRIAEDLTPISYHDDGSKLPEVDMAPIRLPRIPFLYGEANSFQPLVAGIPVLDANLVGGDFPRSPRTKIPDSQNLSNIRAPPEQARKGEFYSDVWGLTCIEYLNIFKCLKTSPALSMSLGNLMHWECNHTRTMRLKAFFNLEKQSRNDVKKMDVPPMHSPDLFPTANNRIHQQCLARAAVLKANNLAETSKKENLPEVEAKTMSTEERNALFFEKLKARIETRIESGAGALVIDAGMGGHRQKRGLKGEDRTPSSSHQKESTLMSGEWRSPLQSVESGFNQSKSQLRPSCTHSERLAYATHPMPTEKENYPHSFQHKMAAAQSYPSLSSHFAPPPPPVTPNRHSGGSILNQEWGLDQGYSNPNSQEWQNDDFPMTPTAQYNPLGGFPQGILMIPPLVGQSPISMMPPLGGHFSSVKLQDHAKNLGNGNEMSNPGIQLVCPPSNPHPLDVDGDLLCQDEPAREIWDDVEMGDGMQRIWPNQKNRLGDNCCEYNGNQMRLGLRGCGGRRGGRHSMNRLFS